MFANPSRARSALTSSWATSPLVFLTVVPLITYSIWSRFIGTIPNVSWGLALLAAAFALSLGFLYYFVTASILTSKHVRMTPTPRNTLLVWVSVGVVTGLGAVLGRIALHGSPDYYLTAFAVTAIAIILGLAFSTYGVEVFTERRKQLIEVEKRQVRLRAIQEEVSAYAQDQRAFLVRTIDRVVTPELDRLRQQAQQLGDEPSANSIAGLQYDVNAYSTNVVRSLSREIADDSESLDVTPVSRLTGESIFRELVSVLLSATLNAPLVIFLAAILALAQFRIDCTGDLLFALSAFLLIEAILGLIGQIPLLQRRVWGCGWLIFSAVFGYWAFRAILTASPDRCGWSVTPFSAAIGAIVAGGTLLALAAVIEATREMRLAIADVGRTNEEIIEATSALRTEGTLTRDLASQVLHGPVQGRLSALSMALQIHLTEVAAGGHPSIAELNTRISSLLDDVADDVHHIIHQQMPAPEGLPDVIIRVTDQWRGLVAISSDIPDEVIEFLAVSPSISALAGECVEEAVTNASRHGHARHAHVSARMLQPPEADVLIIVDDDGVGVDPGRSPGLGLTRIENLGGTWDLESLPAGGSRLSVRLTRSARPPIH